MSNHLDPNDFLDDETPWNDLIDQSTSHLDEAEEFTEEFPTNYLDDPETDPQSNSTPDFEHKSSSSSPKSTPDLDPESLPEVELTIEDLFIDPDPEEADRILAAASSADSFLTFAKQQLSSNPPHKPHARVIRIPVVEVTDDTPRESNSSNPSSGLYNSKNQPNQSDQPTASTIIKELSKRAKKLTSAELKKPKSAQDSKLLEQLHNEILALDAAHSALVSHPNFTAKTALDDVVGRYSTSQTASDLDIARAATYLSQTYEDKLKLISQALKQKRTATASKSRNRKKTQIRAKRSNKRTREATPA